MISHHKSIGKADVENRTPPSQQQNRLITYTRDHYIDELKHLQRVLNINLYVSSTFESIRLVSQIHSIYFLSDTCLIIHHRIKIYLLFTISCPQLIAYSAMILQNIKYSLTLSSEAVCAYQRLLSWLMLCLSKKITKNRHSAMPFVIIFYTPATEF